MAKSILIHIGKGEDRKTYTFDYGELLNTEAIAMEQVTGRGLLEIMKTLPKLSMISVTAVLWMLRLRDEPSLQFVDVQFKFTDLEVEEVLADAPAPEPADPKDEPAAKSGRARS